MKRKPKTKSAAPAKPDSSMPLLTFARQHYLTTPHHHSRKLSTQAQAYKVSQLCGELASLLGRNALVADLTLDTLGRLKRQIEGVYANRTVEYTVGLFKALLRYAGELGIVPVPDELLPRQNFDQPFEQGAPGTLLALCEREYFALSEVNAPNTKRCYRGALSHYGRFLGHDPRPVDLDDDLVRKWMKEQLASCKSVYTVRERLGRILALWRWMACRRLVERFPTIKRPEGPELVPVAMSQEQLKALFDAAYEEPGTIAGIRAGFWWQGLFSFLWSTAERRGAALALRWDMIYFDRKLVAIPAKARKGQRKSATYPLWDEVQRFLLRIAEPKRDLVFPWPFSEGKYYHNYGRILERAGLPNDEKHKSHCLRRSHATWLEALGGDATKSLGHSDRATTVKSYIDPRHLPQPERKLFVPWTPDLSGVDDDISGSAFL